MDLALEELFVIAVDTVELLFELGPESRVGGEALSASTRGNSSSQMVSGRFQGVIVEKSDRREYFSSASFTQY